MKSTAPRCVLALVLSLIAAGCGDVRRDDEDDDGGAADGGDDGGDDGAEGEFSISVAPARLFLRQGESASLEIMVEREAGFDEAIAVELAGLPSGVTGGTVEIGSRASSAAIELTAAGDATQGAIEVEVTGAAGALSRSAALRLLVAGPPGSLDLSFGEGGRVTYQRDGAASTGRGVLIQPDGAIVVTGTTGNPNTRALTVRFLPDGSVDQSFGEGGAVISDVGGRGAAESIASSGQRILVGGFAGTTDGNDDIALFGYTAAGEPDGGFGVDGVVVINTPFPFGAARDVVVAGDGSLLAIGEMSDFQTSSLEVVRFSAAGAQDADFRIARAETDPASAFLDREGRLVIAGNDVIAGQANFLVARYLSDGTPDASFNGDGFASVSVGADDFASAALEQDDGKLLVVGLVLSSGVAAPALVRLLASGGLDETFADFGTAFPPVGIHPFSAGFDGQGRPIVVGVETARAPARPAVARFSPDGAADETFGADGLATLDLPVDQVGGAASASGFAVDSDGRLVVTGHIGPDGDVAMVVARLWP